MTGGRADQAAITVEPVIQAAGLAADEAVSPKK